MHFVAFLCVIAAIFAETGYSKSRDALENYLPESAAIIPWKAEGPPKIYKGNELYDYIDGGAQIFFEYGFTEALVQRYVLGDTSITLEIYQMNDPKAAFGIYSIQRDCEMPALEVGDDGTASDNLVGFIQERFYVVITTNRATKDTRRVSVEIARAVSQKINKSSQLPDVLGILPASHLVPRSTGYVSGLLGLNTQLYLGDSDILGINGRTVEGVFARYKIKKDQAHLLAIRYPDPAAASAALHRVREALAKRYKAATIKDIPVFLDRKNRLYYLAAERNRLYIINRSDSIELIKELESSIRRLTDKRK